MSLQANIISSCPLLYRVQRDEEHGLCQERAIRVISRQQEIWDRVLSDYKVKKHALKNVRGWTHESADLVNVQDLSGIKCGDLMKRRKRVRFAIWPSLAVLH